MPSFRPKGYLEVPVAGGKPAKTDTKPIYQIRCGIDGYDVLRDREVLGTYADWDEARLQLRCFEENDND